MVACRYILTPIIHGDGTRYDGIWLCMCMYVHMRACVRACVRVRARACVSVSVCSYGYYTYTVMHTSNKGAKQYIT